MIVGTPSSILAQHVPARVDRDARESAWMARYLDAAERARSRMRRPHAPATEAAYWAAWRRWGAHCSGFNVEPLPIDVDAMLSWLELISEVLAPNTVRLYLAALCSLDQAHAVELGDHVRERGSLRRDARVRAWLTSWSRDNPTAPRKRAPALSVAQLDAMLCEIAERPGNVSAQQHIATSARDRAILLVGVCAALRVSELVQLALSDVELVERGLRVTVRRSKTDQTGHGHLRGIAPQARIARCPIEALGRWLAIRGREPGPLFCPIARGGEVVRRQLTTRAVQAMITARARAAGVELVSAHTLRATFATLAAEKGRSLHRIADQGGWRSLEVLRGYVRQASLFDDNASSGLLDL